MGSMFFENNFFRGQLYYFNKAFFFSLLLLFLILLVPLKNFCSQFFLERYSETVLLSEGLPCAFFPYSAEEMSLSLWGEKAIEFLTGVKISQPWVLLCEELNLIPERSLADFVAWAAPLVEEEGGEEDFYLPSQEEELKNWFKIPEDEFPPVQLDGEPMLLIYNTHNAESYSLTQGKAHLPGENGGIATVSKVLRQTLQNKHRLKTIYSDVIHDYPEFNKAYLNSRKTVKAILQKHPQIQVVLDLHRDSGLQKRSDTLVRINNQDCAKILIVVGTAHPQWRENLAFAQKIEKKANELYPGLLKAVRLYKERTYNQNLHSRALLFEFGSDLNKEEDALASAKLMADVLAAVLKN